MESQVLERLSWEAMCDREDLQGRWVALQDCDMDEETGATREANIVDVDDSLAELCERIRTSERTNCQILRCTRSPDD